MGKIFSYNSIPTGSLLQEDKTEWDYVDYFMVKINMNVSIDKITTEVFRSPKWVTTLMQIRNSIVKCFGLKTEATKTNESDYYPIGSKAMAFTVTNRNQNEIVMSENDTHLLFLTSVFHKEEEGEIHVTTTVKYNNSFGKLYFSIIKPFHKIVVKSLTKGLYKKL